MLEVKRKRAVFLEWQAKLPLLLRIIAVAGLALAVTYSLVSFYRSRVNEPFKMKSQAPELSKNVKGVVVGYERKVTDGTRLTLLVRAARDVTYTDDHHELEDVLIEYYAQGSEKPDRITAQRAIYQPDNGPNTSDTVRFVGNVVVDTRDALNVKTEEINFDRTHEVADTTRPVNFVRDNISGTAVGARIEAKNKLLDLNNDVHITVAPEQGSAGSQSQDPANKASKPEVTKEREGATVSVPVNINSAHARFDQNIWQLQFSGGASAEQGTEIMSGDSLIAYLSAKRRVEKIEVRGNGYLRTLKDERTTELHAAEIGFFMDERQQLRLAKATKDVKVHSIGASSQMQLTGANELTVQFQTFQDRSVVKQMVTGGRSIVTLLAPEAKAADPRAANKRITADKLTLAWRPDGKDLLNADASGSAVLVIEPVNPGPKADKQTLTAPSFLCEFFEAGNLAKSFTATGGAAIVIEPSVSAPDRGVRTLTADRMVAAFVRDTQALDEFDAIGNAKFNEQDRNGLAATMNYTAVDQVVHLRGGEPTVWDVHARTKAVEMDSDMLHKISYGRVKVATTYYSQEQTGAATPFAKVKSPVFLTADQLEVNHETGVATYTGKARAWQDDNFVRADKIILRRDQKSLLADGHVQSAVYQLRRKDQRGVETVVPAFAVSDRMTYTDVERILHYEGSVDIRQGTDRINCGVADAYLHKENNEVEKTVAQNDVVLTQPGRRGTGDWAQYTVADETFVLKGAPALVEDASQGSTSGPRLTVYNRENRIVAEGSVAGPGAGRVRSTHKIATAP